MIALLNGMTPDELHDARQAARVGSDGLPPLEGSTGQVARAGRLRGELIRGAERAGDPELVDRIRVERVATLFFASLDPLLSALRERLGERTSTPAGRPRSGPADEASSNPISVRGKVMSIRNGKDLEIDPLADLFPPMAEEEFARLKADIAAQGQLEPIWTYRGRVVDGRHRLRACRELGLEPVVRAYDGDGPVLDFVVAKNLHRRHLTTTQRALVAAKIMPEFEAEARANMGRGGQGLADLPPAHSRDRAAAVVGVSSRLVGSAAQILGRGVPELVAALERGQVKVSAAAAVATLDDAELAELVARGPKAIRARASELRRAEKATPEDGLSKLDREWLKGLPLWGQLTDRSTFIREAMVWKRVQPLLDQVRLAFPGLDAESRELIIDPHKIHLVVHLLNLRPPEGWKVCFRCTGTGSSDDPRDPRCSWCRGEGFEITQRNWGEPPST